ncbi:MAG: hypothetical protein H0T57_06340 [Rubrobacter sp.]|nr:hypothetical protein [Rubrobacter sp.]MDQ3636884.1 hypothetical protein [Actinomycetota bacterium]
MSRDELRSKLAGLEDDRKNAEMELAFTRERGDRVRELEGLRDTMGW